MPFVSYFLYPPTQVWAHNGGTDVKYPLWRYT
jgi:hypothetical protein